MSVDAKIMTVVSAIKQSLQTSASPGSSINTHPNPFFLNVSGEMNLKHAAEPDPFSGNRRVRGSVESERLRKSIKEAEAKAAQVEVQLD